MRIPNKLYSYDESVFPLFPLVANALQQSPMTPGELFAYLQDACPEVSDFTDVLDSLFALGIVAFDAERKVLTLAN